MADTKKEHYVPRCYLESFATVKNKINVFDKWKMTVRSDQDIMNIAMENGFYDLDLLGVLQNEDRDSQERIKQDLKKIVGTEDWENVKTLIGDKKYIEKKHFAELEGIYSELLRTLIKKSYSGSDWVIKNCFALSEKEKMQMSIFIVIQILRTKRCRGNLDDILMGIVQALAQKAQLINASEEESDISDLEANPTFIKLQHSSIILDQEMACNLAEVLCGHVWMMCVNKTSIPFITSDDPVIVIPHKKDNYISYAGLGSEGIEIAFPITPNLMLCMFDRKAYGHLIKDRQFYEITAPETIEYYNLYQAIDSYRCVYSSTYDFESIKKYFESHPELQGYQPHIDVQ